MSRRKVLIQGVPSIDLTDEKKRNVFGYVEQSFHMVPGSVKDQITLYDTKISDANVKKAAELTGLAETIEALPDKYDTLCTPDLFSQGQWQLLSIAARLRQSRKSCSSMRLRQTSTQKPRKWC